MFYRYMKEQEIWKEGTQDPKQRSYNLLFMGLV